MRNFVVSLATALLLATATLHSSDGTTTANAANMTLKIKNDKRRIIDFGVFGYGGPNEGIMELKVNDFLIHDLDEYDSVDEKIGFALDLVPSAAYARRERNSAIKLTKQNGNDGNDGSVLSRRRTGDDASSSSASSGDDAATSSASSVYENLCFVDDPSFTPETRYLLPLQESLARIGRKVEKDAKGAMTKVQKATALRNLARNLSASIAIRPDKPGYYALFFYNCKKANRNRNPVPITFRVKISQFNVIGTAEENVYRSFLSYGDTRLPEIYLFAFVIFAALTTVWHIVLYGNGGGSGNAIIGDGGNEGGKSGGIRGRKQQQQQQNSAGGLMNMSGSSASLVIPPTPPKLIHKLMYALLILKCLSLFFEAVMLNRRRASGKLSAYVDFIFYGFQAVKGFFLFTIILLLGSGWSLLKPFLSDRDRKILILLLPLQLLVNVALMVIGESSEGSKYWSWWRDTLRLFDLGCCLAVLLPVITSIYSLRATSDRAEQQRLGRLRQFRTFYVVVVSYMFITRVALDYVAAAAPYNLTWTPAVIGEFGALFLYVTAGYMFRPAAQAEWEREDRIAIAAAAEELDDAEEIELGDDDDNNNIAQPPPTASLIAKNNSSAQQQQSVVVSAAAAPAKPKKVVRIVKTTTSKGRRQQEDV